MKKRYILTYDFFGVTITKEYTNTRELAAELDRLDEDTNVLMNTVEIQTIAEEIELADKK